MDLQLDGRTAIVTGASSGIGAGAVRSLAKEGVRVAAVARESASFQAMVDDLCRETGANVFTVGIDVTADGATAEIVKRASEVLGPIDILINGVGGSRPVTPQAGDDAWDEAFALNFTPQRRLTTALLPSMRERKWGRIITISGSIEPRSLNAAAAAKGAIHVWSKGLSCDVAADGVTMNVIAPGRINSRQILEQLHPTEESRRDFIGKHIPIGYFGEPEDVGNLIAFLASPLARYITGAVVPVDGGSHYYSY